MVDTVLVSATDDYWLGRALRLLDELLTDPDVGPEPRKKITTLIDECGAHLALRKQGLPKSGGCVRNVSRDGTEKPLTRADTPSP